MSSHRITHTTLAAIMIATTAALVARAIVQRRLTDSGYDSALAADLSYLVVPPILLALLFPIWKTEKPYVAAQFRRADINWRIALRAVAIGVLLRVAWWSQLVAGIALGFHRAPDNVRVAPFSISFDCPSAITVGTGFLLMVFLVPLIEEVTHRGYIQGILHRRGLVLSVLISAMIFTVFHRYSSWLFVFTSGSVLGVQYWLARSLWPSFISHATINALIQIDWRCMQGQWIPATDSIPLVAPAAYSIAILMASIAAIIVLLRETAIGARCAPR
jgi:membrane protease YdiL (CAAX protease family)